MLRLAISRSARHPARSARSPKERNTLPWRSKTVMRLSPLELVTAIAPLGSAATPVGSVTGMLAASVPSGSVTFTAFRRGRRHRPGRRRPHQARHRGLWTAGPVGCAGISATFSAVVENLDGFAGRKPERSSGHRGTTDGTEAGYDFGEEALPSGVESWVHPARACGGKARAPEPTIGDVSVR